MAPDVRHVVGGDHSLKMSTPQLLRFGCNDFLKVWRVDNGCRGPLRPTHPTHTEGGCTDLCLVAAVYWRTLSAVSTWIWGLDKEIAGCKSQEEQGS